MERAAQLRDKLQGKSIEGGRIALDGCLQFKPLSAGHDCYPVIADSPTDYDTVSGKRMGAVNLQIMLKNSDSRRIDKYPVSFAARHDFGVTGDNSDPGTIGSPLHGSQNPGKLVFAESFFKDQAHTHPERFRSHHGKVVDRSVHGEIADIATGEKYRIDDKGIGRKCETSGRRVKERRIVLDSRFTTGECRNYQFVQKLMRQSAATAVTKKYEIIIHAVFSGILTSASGSKA
jgi:hypothetical protein